MEHIIKTVVTGILTEVLAFLLQDRIIRCRCFYARVVCLDNDPSMAIFRRYAAMLFAGTSFLFSSISFRSHKGI